MPLSSSALNKTLLMTREARGLTLEQLAEKTGLDLSTISRLEREPRDARTSSLVKLSDALEVSIAFLLGSEDQDLEFPVAVRRQALRRFLMGSPYDDQQKRDFEQLCFLDSAPNSVRGWQDLTQNCSFLQTHRAVD
jgi:transcriptional regulator with XRE-family HTH domain